MISLLRAAALAAAFAVASCGSLPAHPVETASRSETAPVKLAPGEWPQARSDLAPDPDIRFGALPNGMRYAIRKQAIPPGQAALRLRLDAGSLMEADDQQGLAHFLEHMAFNGSTGVPEGDMVKILERLGLAFGADTNASTNFHETVYKLDLPRTDTETVDTSLMLMREAAGALLIAPDAVDRERGVVLSEERTRDTPAYRVFRQRMEFLLRGQLPPKRLPIGQVEVLRTAPAARIADFYHRYYRPERAVLVAVGDFDVDAMEAKIRARFGDWSATGPAGAEPDLNPPQPRAPEARLVIEPGLPASLLLAWVAPPDLAPDTTADRQRRIVESLGFAVLNRRFSRISRGAEPPFIGAAAHRADQYKSARITMVSVNVQPGRWREAVSAAEQEQRRAVRYGVRQDELDREITEVRTVMRARVAGAATRRPEALAGEIVGSLSDDEVVTNPAQELALFEASVKGLKAAHVSQALADAFKADGPLFFMTSPAPIEGGEPALLAALQASQRTPVVKPAARAVQTWPYADFGAAGQVTQERKVDDLGATFYTFANGVRLTVKPTSFRDDEVLVRVNVADGLQDLSPQRQNPGWASSAYVEGGLKKISAEDLEQVLADKVYGARFANTDDAFVLSGSTRPGDLDTQMQVLAAYLTEPGWRPEAFARVKSAAATIHDQYESTVGGVLARDLAGLLHQGDRRWTFPTREEIADARLSDLQDPVVPPMAEGPIEVVIVGDITLDRAVAATAKTFGALPQRPAAAPVPPEQLKVAFPPPPAQPVVRTHKGRADQAAGYVAWPTTDFFADPQRARETAVMGEVMSLRLTDELREAQGATYSPAVGYSHSMTWPGWGYVSASVEVPPAKLDDFFRDVGKIAADLRANPPSADELARARQPRLERLERARKTNEYWLSELSGAQTDPRKIEATRDIVPGTQKVTAADVQRAAQTYLRDDKAWRLVVRPEATARQPAIEGQAGQ